MTVQEQPIIHLGSRQPDFLATLARMTAQRVVPRIWERDHTVWKPDPAEIANRLGWLEAPDNMGDKTAGMAEFVAGVREEGYTHALLLGMGGSSLAAEVLRGHLAADPIPLDLAILDSTAPEAVLAAAERSDPARTLYIVSTKSGGTVETISFFRFFYQRAVAAWGPAKAGRHFVAITDPGSGVAQLAERYAFRATFLNDPHIGGRNAALSYVGLLPAAMVGVDLPRLLDRARAMAHACSAPPPDNPAARLGAALGVLAQAGRDKMTLVLSPALAHLGDWIEQLIAESTGKEGRGILPVVGEEPAGPAAYGEDRYFVYLRLQGDTTHGTAVQALAEAGFPLIRMTLRDPYDLGGQFFLWEMANAVAGHLLGVNPFDQPNVESAKALARQMVAAYRQTGALPPASPAPLTAGALRGFLKQARPGDYVSIQAYLAPTEETTAALQQLRLALRDRLRLATTVGYGPRFLHSTGQLHKGDAGRGLFIQFTADNARDAVIPEEGAEPGPPLTFGVLQRAQAMGDRQALLANGRRVIHFHLGTDAPEGIRKLLR